MPAMEMPEASSLTLLPKPTSKKLVCGAPIARVTGVTEIFFTMESSEVKTIDRERVTAPTKLVGIPFVTGVEIAVVPIMTLLVTPAGAEGVHGVPEV